MTTFAHGHAARGNKSSTYNIWTGMRQRCGDPNCKLYKWYGGRGIKVCDRWDDFKNFLMDMGKRPEGYSIDREDNDGNYTPDNCRWVSREINMRNRRNTFFVEVEGQKVPLVELCGGYGKRYKTVWHRIQKADWDVMKALETPTGNNGGKNKDTATEAKGYKI